MNEHTEMADMNYIKLKRVSTLGFMAVLIWFSIIGGLLFLLSGDLLGWLSLGIGVFLLGVPFTAPFRRYWATGNSAKVFPLIVFAASIGLIIIYGSVLLALLSDPFVFYNDQNTFSVYLWAGAAILSIIALLANLGAFIVDRRQPKQEPA